MIIKPVNEIRYSNNMKDSIEIFKSREAMQNKLC